MKYINTVTQEVKQKREIVDSIKAFTSLGPNTLAELNWTPVMAAPKPAPSGDTKHFTGSVPVQDANGNWVEGYVEVDMFADTTEDGVTTTKAEHEAVYLAKLEADKAAAERTKRDSLLAATDWTASTDITMTAEMTTYRQALRDVPSQAGFPDTIDWPTSPQ